MIKAPVTKQVLHAAGASSGNGNVAECPYAEVITIVVTGTAGISAGAVQVETSDVNPYTGTWAPQGTPVSVIMAGATKITIQLSGPHNYLRLRISTNVVDGTIGATVAAL